MKALVGAFNQEKALVGAFSVIVQPVVEPMDRFAALIKILLVQGDAGDGRDGRQVQAGGQRYPGRVHGGVQGGGSSQGYKQYRIIKYLEIDILQTFIIRQARSSHKPKWYIGTANDLVNKRDDDKAVCILNLKLAWFY